MDNSLIFRQAAIDAVNNAFDRETLLTGFVRSIAVRAIRDMPSAQLEPKWIPCDETVDIPDHEVMACDRYGEFIIGYLDCKDEQWLCESDDSLMYNPVAWRELPKPYKEGGVNSEGSEDA